MQAKVPGSGDLRHHLRGEELVRERRGIRLTGRAFAASALRSRRTVQASPAGRRPAHASGGTRAVQPSRAGHVPAAWLRDRLAVPVHGGMNTLAGAEALHRTRPGPAGGSSWPHGTAHPGETGPRRRPRAVPRSVRADWLAEACQVRLVPDPDQAARTRITANMRTRACVISHAGSAGHLAPRPTARGGQAGSRLSSPARLAFLRPGRVWGC